MLSYWFPLVYEKGNWGQILESCYGRWITKGLICFLHENNLPQPSIHFQLNDLSTFCKIIQNLNVKRLF